MDIIIHSWDSKWRGPCQQLTINGKVRAYVGTGEPEDMRIGRDLVPVTTMVKFMHEAYLAGKHGELFTELTLNKDPDEEDD